MKSVQQVLLFIFCCVGIGFLAGGILAWKYPGKLLTRPDGTFMIPSIPLINPTKPKTAHIILVGDIMVDRGVENSVKNNMGGDFGKLFEHIGDYLKTSDAVFGNLEGPVTAKGVNVGSRFSFAMDNKILPVLVANNFKMVSFANNHVGDRSNSGFADTLVNLDAAGLPYTGAGKNITEVSTPRITVINGVRIGFIGCTDVGPDWLAATASSPGILLCNNDDLGKIITYAKTQVDFLIFSAHWGVEYYPRTKRQQDIAHTVIDHGADMVIGHHPHVIEATEWYKDKFIAYSLGNFIFDQYFSDATMQGLIVDAVIDPKKKTVVTLKVVELTKSGNKYQPERIRDAADADFITKSIVAAQTCPSSRDSAIDKWLYPVGPDLDIGNYIPKNLVPLDNRISVKTTALCLTEPAANALVAMVGDMEKEGLSITMTSGFRSRDVQTSIHSASAPTLTVTSDTGSTKYPSVALPGHSEHQLGVALDLKSGSDPTFSYDNFKNSPEYAWLSKNAWNYGFIQSYQPGTESITGYIAESWHYRYVGKDHVEEIRDQGISTYEYLKNL